MLKIRLARVGKKNKPQFKVVLQEHTVAPGGRHVEVLGSYDPHSKNVVLKKERIEYWLGQGVQMSDTVHNLLVSQEVVKGPKIAVKMPKKAEEAKEAEGSPVEKKEEAVTDEKKTKESPKAEKPEEKKEQPTPEKVEAKPEEAKSE